MVNAAVGVFDRPNWDEYFINGAKWASTRATCPRASVGAIIVSADNRVLSTGYNGAGHGEPHCFEVGCDVVDNHCQRALHAEVNAIAYAARAGISLEGSRMYVYGYKGGACRECAKVIKAAGITIAAMVGPGEALVEPETY